LAEKEARQARTTALGRATSGWKTETPVKGSERVALAKLFPWAFLVFEEKMEKSTGESYFLPLFPIVARSALRTGIFLPDSRALEAARRRYLQHLDKFKGTNVDKQSNNIKQMQSK
jgi:hypothetical protein